MSISSIPSYPWTYNRLITTLKDTDVSVTVVCVSVWYSSEYDEYVACLHVNGERQEDADYFDSDRASCLRTARFMLENWIDDNG